VTPELQNIALCSTSDSSTLSELTDLFRAAWAEFESLEASVKDCPDPIAALNASGRAIGGLAFRRARTPNGSNQLWINALYVDPDFRGKGVASQLIKHAERVAERYATDSFLYVYTEYPQLYEPIGWQRVTSDSEHPVLRRQVSSTAKHCSAL
jgi:GNAT superfamily N-acetyltransferase